MQRRRQCLLSPRLRRKKRMRFITVSFYASSFVLVVFFGMGLVLNSSFLSIKNVNVIGPNDEQSYEIKNITNNEMSKNHLGIFYKDNFLLVNKSKLAELIKKSFPEFRDVKLSLAGLGGLNINIQKRIFFANWCDENGEKCFPVDDSGFAYSDSALSSSGTTLNIILKNRSPQIGESLAPEVSMDKIKKYLEIFNQSEFNISKILIDNGEYFITVKDGILLKTSLSNNPEEVLNNLNSIKTGSEDGMLENIDYIDLRYGKKIFLKRR